MGNGANMYWILMVVEHALDVHPGMSPRAKTRAAHLNSPGHTTSTSILTRNPRDIGTPNSNFPCADTWNSFGTREIHSGHVTREIHGNPHSDILTRKFEFSVHGHVKFIRDS